jgi:hypothetical protein
MIADYTSIIRPESNEGRKMIAGYISIIQSNAVQIDKMIAGYEHHPA